MVDSAFDMGSDDFHGAEESLTIPDSIPILVIENIVIYPSMIAPIIVTDDRSKKLINDALSGSRIIGLFARRSDEEGFTGFDQIFEIGTAGMILKMLRMPDGSMRLLVHGMSRVKITGRLAETPYLRAEIDVMTEVQPRDTESQAMVKSAHQMTQTLVEFSTLPEDFSVAALNLSEPSKLCDLIATNLSLHLAEQQEILEISSVKRRLKRVLEHLSREIELLKLGDKIQTKVRTAIDKSQREYMLREQLKAIHAELGIGEDGDPELIEMREAFTNGKAYPENVQKIALRELDRLAQMSTSSAEYTVSRTYLDWLHELPWHKSTDDRIDLRKAGKVLNEDHHALEKIKERILEHLAVIKLKPDQRGPILCFAGPPGVGKTSLGRSIARALGREFHRMSLGGVHDEAEIRGHRRTYIGSMPGRVIKAIRNCGSNNPVIMLDEIDKIASDFRGDPQSALLEVLDPEQNSHFMDNYLDIPFDLSKTMFITTANILDTISPPLRDRMEVLQLSGYTPGEKLHIAKKHLIPKQIKNHGLKRTQIRFTDEGIRTVIEEYTREAGVRNLEREIGTLCRKVAKGIASGRGSKKIVLDQSGVRRRLGNSRHDSVEAMKITEPGVVIGMAWTQFGGDLLAIEVSTMPGKGKLALTGQLGDVMKESAQAALTHLRAQARKLGIDSDQFSEQDIHVHVPEGAIPKDGPSAGITMATALASALLGRRAVESMAMTGEITLKGQVLPVGGIKEKVMAAHRAGLKTVLLPSKNRRDAKDIPKEVRDDLQIKFVSKMSDVLKAALEA